MDQALTDLSPRTAALIAGLHACTGNRKQAEVWLIELIAWIVFSRQDGPRVAPEAPTPIDVFEPASV